MLTLAWNYAIYKIYKLKNTNDRNWENKQFTGS